MSGGSQIIMGKNGEPLYAQVNRDSKKPRTRTSSGSIGNGSITTGLSLPSNSIDQHNYAEASSLMSHNPRSTKGNVIVEERISKTSNNAWI
uniref:CSON008573 protein n=1 Tax=Culicoides sonorensis TaxID=179676 RepID=A0A336MYM9_CULSO